MQVCYVGELYVMGIWYTDYFITQVILAPSVWFFDPHPHSTLYPQVDPRVCCLVLCVPEFSSDFLFKSFVSREYTLYDFKPFQLTDTSFTDQNMIPAF